MGAARTHVTSILVILASAILPDSAGANAPASALRAGDNVSTQIPTRSSASPSPLGARIVAAARDHLGAPYVFGGRNARFGCRSGGRLGRCAPGIDCQSLIFFAFEKVTKKPWTKFSVMPSISVRRGELGRRVPGLEGVLRKKLDPRMLERGDVLFFLYEGYNLEADTPLFVQGGKKYGVWHTGLVHGRVDDRVEVIHAKPGESVVVESLDEIGFDALYVLRP